MWSVSETIENGIVCVSASPSVWIVDRILYWPPGIANRSLISSPESNWIPHLCRVLKENIGKCIGILGLLSIKCLKTFKVS